MTNLQLAIQFFLQIALILSFCRVVGIVAARFGQPQVVAEMIAGVLLGPSLLGLFFPGASKVLFPPDSMKVLFPVSQLGLALYMFVVGMEFRVDIVRKRMGSAIAVSLAGMAAPFVLGGLLGWYFHAHTELFPAKTSLAEAVLFLGASMCITAFPMLARIIHFKGLSGTTMGTVALGAGAIDDAAAWCLLAIVLASFDGNMSHAVLNIAGGVGYVAVTLMVIRPLLARWLRDVREAEQFTDSQFVVCLSLLALGAWITDAIGLHAVFGAFVMGAAMPRGVVSQGLITRIQPLTVALLLPMFFTFSGLNTQIGLLKTVYLWEIAIVVLLAAVVGKGVACWLAARATGLPNREALGIGTLMNARGLMELIIINIGLQRGIISPELFAVLVIMAIVTTLMASPIFELLVGRHSKKIADAERELDLSASQPATASPKADG
ncbi:cation:proton antiporter domain-containing protein [Humisphaera borealis]|uniref:Cation:proton antiporter n=1 Tax=Humisphaera borealis TaxID=2807512 RepID=A0A7M2WXF6_9BACT|nr:cation:proton antiporter [Humisphaera borealis]QOV89190.1 cation:proton antiporter [Humisphaera borealis]